MNRFGIVVSVLALMVLGACSSPASAPASIAVTELVLSPAAGATGVTADRVSVRVPSALVESSVNASHLTVSVNGIPVSGTVTFDSPSNTLMFVPNERFAGLVTYQVVVADSLPFVSGQRLAGLVRWSFTTAALPVDDGPDPESPEPENPDPESPEPENPDPENPDPESPEPENPDPESPEPENPDPELPGGGLRFDFSDALGVQLGTPDMTGLGMMSSSAPSGLLKVTGNGSLIDPLVQGNATIESFFIRNGHIYVLFRQDYWGWDEPESDIDCYLGRIAQDGTVTCVDSDLSSININSIQFDGDDGVYYQGYLESSGREVVRRWMGGETIDYYRLPHGQRINGFTVTRDGLVILDGVTSGGISETRWLRVITETGFSTDLIDEYDNHPGGFWSFLPDGSILLNDNYWGHGLRRLHTHDGVQFDPRSYSGGENSRFDYLPYIGSWDGRYLTGTQLITWNENGIWRVYPEAEPLDLPVTHITNAHASNNFAAISGRDGSTYRALFVNLVDDSWVDMLAGRRIEVVRMQVDAAAEVVQIFGMDLDRTQPVLAEYSYRFNRLEVADVDADLTESFQVLDWTANHVPPATLIWQPEPEFTFELGVGWEAGIVSFDATVTPNIAFIDHAEWDFGDGSSGEGLTPSHTYSEAGNYSVQLTLTNDIGESTTITDSIYVPEAHLVESVHANGTFLTAAGELYYWDQNAIPEPYMRQALFDQPVRVYSGDIGGYYHSLVLLDDGSVLAWGYNSYGQLGDGTTRRSEIPVRVSGLPIGITKVVAASYASLALTDDGDLYAWGSTNLDGIWSISTPAHVSNIPEPVVDVVVTGSSYYALTESGTIYAWGENGNGQLGNGSTDYGYIPQPVLLTDAIVTSVYASANSSNVFALTDEGDAYGWGSNEGGRINSSIIDRDIYTPAPLLPLDAPFTQLYPIDAGMIAVSEAGTVYAWGPSSELGYLIGSDSRGLNIPTVVPYFTAPPTSVTSGLAVGNNEVHAWGHHSMGYSSTNGWQVHLRRIR